MSEVTTHHDGHGLNESIVIVASEPGPGGASHFYDFMIEGKRVAMLQFQEGPRNVEGSIPGVTTSAVIAALIDHLSGFQSGGLANAETSKAIKHLEMAMAQMKNRADNRAQRGVLGTMNK
ncbi:MAG: hypothetical protein WBV94_21815 [Blastocatellia bacterium]